MLNYAICQIGGKQYKVIPGQAFEVSLPAQTDAKIQAEVLLLSADGKLEIGVPYLKDKLVLEKIEQIKGSKIRVAKFHHKANYRRVRGYRSSLSKVVLPVKKAS